MAVKYDNPNQMRIDFTKAETATPSQQKLPTRPQEEKNNEPQEKPTPGYLFDGFQEQTIKRNKLPIALQERKRVSRYIKAHKGKHPRRLTTIDKRLEELNDKMVDVIEKGLGKDEKLLEIKNERKSLQEERSVREIMERISRKERGKISASLLENTELCKEVFGINILYNVYRIFRPSHKEPRNEWKGGPIVEGNEKVINKNDPKLYSILSCIKNVFGVDTSKIDVICQQIGKNKNASYCTFSFVIKKENINLSEFSEREREVLKNLKDDIRFTVFVSDNYANATYTLVNNDKDIYNKTKEELVAMGAKRTYTPSQTKSEWLEDGTREETREETLAKKYKNVIFSLLNEEVKKQIPF